jgi:hypothetical protein
MLKAKTYFLFTLPNVKETLNENILNLETLQSNG